MLFYTYGPILYNNVAGFSKRLLRGGRPLTIPWARWLISVPRVPGKGGGGKSEKAKSVAIKGGQKGELLERGGNVGDIVAGAKKVGARNKGKDTARHRIHHRIELFSCKGMNWYVHSYSFTQFALHVGQVGGWKVTFTLTYTLWFEIETASYGKIKIFPEFLLYCLNCLSMSDSNFSLFFCS